MEYVAGGNLHQLVNQYGGLSEKLARWFFQQLIVALDYCHKVGRFIRPDSCMTCH